MYDFMAYVTHAPLLRDRLIVEILIFVALCSPDSELSRGITRCFCPQAAQICAFCAKGALFEVFTD